MVFLRVGAYLGGGGCIRPENSPLPLAGVGGGADVPIDVDPELYPDHVPRLQEHVRRVFR